MVNVDRVIGPGIAGADLGGSRDGRPLSFHLCFIFKHFATEIMRNNRLRPPLGWAF